MSAYLEEVDKKAEKFVNKNNKLGELFPIDIYKLEFIDPEKKKYKLIENDSLLLTILSLITYAIGNSDNNIHLVIIQNDKPFNTVLTLDDVIKNDKYNQKQQLVYSLQKLYGLRRTRIHTKKMGFPVKENSISILFSECPELVRFVYNNVDIDNKITSIDWNRMFEILNRAYYNIKNDKSVKYMEQFDKENKYEQIRILISYMMADYKNACLELIKLIS
jgi:hypothetical protein